MGVLGADYSDSDVHGTCLVHSQDSNSDFRRQQVETNRLCRSDDSDSCTSTSFARIEIEWERRALDTSADADLPTSIHGSHFPPSYTSSTATTWSILSRSGYCCIKR